MSQHALEEIGKGHETIEGFLAGGELDEEINVAARAGFTASHGAEECKAPDAKLADLSFNRKQALDGLVPGWG